MAIALFPKLEGESLEDVSIKLAEKWRIGQKGLNNGIILVVFVQDRKLRFEVGYGLEAVVPDIVAGQIIREIIAPRFREGRYAAGLSAAVDAVYGRLEGKAPQPSAREKPRQSRFPIVGFVVVGLIIVFILGSEVVRSRRFTGGGGYTGGGRGWILPIIFFLGGGGGWRGGGGRGEDSGGGGFSGGGGDFGGGGASGDW
jgi:uncharacterized protein